MPIQCARCALRFDTDASLKEHQRRPEGCEVREEGPKEGFDKEQEKRLKSRKRPPIGQTEIEKWNAVYLILFPEDEQIPSPCKAGPLAIVVQMANEIQFMTTTRSLLKRAGNLQSRMSSQNSKNTLGASSLGVSASSSSSLWRRNHNH